ncbi:NADP-dependent oxidoreductase [Amycolatopsis sp. NPDC059657]|uniref:NADP-dependent oxidoreductase n=1 Tax=Amycolatopsis sp. NPDC059657 TaxID=3346899 RepID=UPI00366E097F
MTSANAQIRLAAHPVGLPQPSDWDYTEQPAPQPGPGEFLVRVEYLSLDPAMRSWISGRHTYIEPVALGDVMRAGGIGRIVASQHPDHQVGEIVSGRFGAQRYTLCRDGEVTKVDTALAPAPTHLAALGIAGLTAYFGLFDVGRLEPGQTVVVSGAAGAVGSIAGQIARITGCRVIGIAGGPAKCATLVDELGFDAAIDYKAGDVRARLREHAPDGVDLFFDNVGGAILDDVLTCLATGARVVISGAIAQYNATQQAPGPSNYLQLLTKRASMTGFVIFDYADRYPEAMTRLAEWISTGELVSFEHLVQGDIKDFPETLLTLFRGGNTGKLILALPQDQ